ncbi:hypothetical protein E4T56_gene20690 [Termitomyces sp. T112]|nr:hypothetical protein E4T56_gene20690 [Termitomyces sp. T112]
MYNGDGLLNEAGSICSMVDLVFYYQDYSEQATFAVTSLGKQDMILGLIWLCEHSPEIDWTKEEAYKKQRAKRGPYEDVQGLRCESPEEKGGEEEWTHTSDAESSNETIEVGDWIYALTFCLPPTVAEIQASQTTSQCLAEAFVANSQPKAFCSTVPNHLHDFEDVFSKASFDSLSECKQWDHAIELILDAEPFSCKVYLLAPHEQDELDDFLQENLSSGWI